MFGLRYHLGPPGPGRAREGILGLPRPWVSAYSILRLGLMVLPLAVGLPGGASAQALGTMQVTARVVPGGPAWSGLAQAGNLARQVLLSPAAGSGLNRTGLVQARAELASTGGRRRLLVTVNYPRN